MRINDHPETQKHDAISRWVADLRIALPTELPMISKAENLLKTARYGSESSRIEMADEIDSDAGRSTQIGSLLRQGAKIGLDVLAAMTEKYLALSPARRGED